MTDSDLTETAEELDESDASGLTRRGLLEIIGIGAGASLLAACTPGSSTATPSATASGTASGTGVAADSSRIVLGGQPILDTAFPDGATPLPPLRERVLALKSLLVDKGVLDDQKIQGFVGFYSALVGPQYGKAVVAHAWVDPDFRTAILNPPPGKPFAATKLVADYLVSLKDKTLPAPQIPGFTLGPEGEWLRVVANGVEQASGKRVHNMVSCTACSCYPQALLGVQPVWYKSQQYRARSVRAPRGVMREFAEAEGADAVTKLDAYLAGVDELRVWDSNSETRFLVLPEMPAAYKGLSETELRTKVTRNSMIGVQIL